MPGPDRSPQRLSCNWNPRGGSCPQDLIKLELHRHFLSSACSHNRAFPKGSRRADPHGPQFQLRGRGRRLVSNPGRRPHPQSSHGKIALLVACIAVFRAVAARSSGAEPWRLAVSRSILTLLDGRMATGSIDILAMNSTAISLKERVGKDRIPLVLGIHHAVSKKKSMGRPVKFFEMDAEVSRMDVRVSKQRFRVPSGP